MEMVAISKAYRVSESPVGAPAPRKYGRDHGRSRPLEGEENALREPLHLRCGTSRTSELTCDKKRPASLEGADGASGDSIVETSAVPAPSTRDLRLGSGLRRRVMGERSPGS